MIEPPTNKSNPIPTPPTTCNAPLTVLVLLVEVDTINFDMFKESDPLLEIVTPPISNVALLTNRVLNLRSARPKLNVLVMLGNKSPVTVPLLITVPANVMSVNVFDQKRWPLVLAINTELSDSGIPRSGSAWLTSRYS